MSLPIFPVHGVTQTIGPVVTVAWFTTLLWWIGTAIVSALIEKWMAAKASGPDASPFDIPDVAIGTPIPVIMGTLRVRPIFTWAKPPRTSKVKKEGSIIGYDHGITAQVILCWGKVSGIQNIIFEDDQAITYVPATVSGLNVNGGIDTVATWSGWMFDQFTEILHGGHERWHIYLPNIYGDRDGVQGYFDIYQGIGKQIVSSVMETEFGVGKVPRYPTLSYIVYDNFGFGLAQQPRPIDYVVNTEPMGDNPGGTIASRIIDGGPLALAGGRRSWAVRDWHPVAVIWEAMTNRKYGLAMNKDEIDGGNFNSVAISSNGASGYSIYGPVGVSCALTSRSAASDTIEMCLKVLDAILIRDTDTNKFKIKLIRNEVNSYADYLALPHFDESIIQSMQWSRREWPETFNEVVVTFPNAERLFNSDTVTVRNNASIVETGLRTLKVDMPIVTDPKLALIIAERELKANSLPLGKGQIRCNRKAIGYEQGQVIRVSYDEYGLGGVQCRIQTINIGTGTNAEIVMDIIEDVYSMDAATAANVEPSEPPVYRLPTVIPPEVTTSQSLVGTGTGRLTLHLGDVQRRTYEIAFRSRVGRLGAYSGWTVSASATANTSDPGWPFGYATATPDLNGDHTFDVALSNAGDSAIDYRVRWISADATVATPYLNFEEITGTVTFEGLAAFKYPTWTVDGGGSVIPVGGKCFMTLPAGKLTGWKAQVTPAATIRFDLWKNSSSTVLPTIADSLGLSFGPTATQIASGSLTPITIAEGDNVTLAVSSNDLATFATVTLTLEPS